jgi:hypothetical protein
MGDAAAGRRTRSVRRLPPRGAVLTGGALMGAAGQPWWIGALALPGASLVWALGTLGSDALAEGTALTAVEGALPVLSFAGALAVVGGGPVWRRLAGVAVVAVLTGAINSLVPDAGGVVYVGLVAAVGFLSWVAPRAGGHRSMREPRGL